MDFARRLCYRRAHRPAAMIRDVLICGAGPAGAHAARLLAGQGLDVALFDRATFPREKPCGGAVSRKALALLGAEVDPVDERRVTGAWIAFRGRAVARDAGGVVAAMTRRAALDTLLVDGAVRDGARFFPGHAFERIEPRGDHVRVITSRGAFAARLLLAADGVASAVRRAVLGAGAVEYAPAIEALVEAPGAVVERFADRVLLELGGMAGGYGWIFGKRDHLNVGVYSTRARAGIRGALDAFMARHPALASRTRVRRLGHPIPVRNRAGAFERGRVWLLGDAAGLAEAVLGEGIYFALKSAEIAAGVVADARGAPRPGEYEREVKRALVPELVAAERLARACYARPRFAFERIGRNAGASRLFLGLVTGEVGYRECLLKGLAAAPLWALARREPTQPLEALSL
jgi:geranylgeranyl reductase family protein